MTTYPDGQPSIWQRLTGINVDDTNVEIQVYAGLVLAHIVAFQLTIDSIWSPDRLRCKNASSVLDGVEDVALSNGNPVVIALSVTNVSAALQMCLAPLHLFH